MIDFTLPMRTIDGQIALKLGDSADERFKHVVGVGDDRFNVDDEGDTEDMVGYFVNVPGPGTAEIFIEEFKLRFSAGLPVIHAKRGRGTLVALRGRHKENTGGFGILLDDGPQTDDAILWSVNKNIHVIDGEAAFDANDNVLEITLPESNYIRVVHNKRGPGTLVKVRSGHDKKALLGIRLDENRPKTKGGILWAAFRSVEIPTV